MERCLAVLCILISWKFEKPVIQCSQKTYSLADLSAKQRNYELTILLIISFLGRLFGNLSNLAQHMGPKDKQRNYELTILLIISFLGRLFGNLYQI